MDVEESLHPWDKAHLVMVYDPFNVLLDSTDPRIHGKGSVKLLLQLGRKAHVHGPTREVLHSPSLQEKVTKCQ